MNSLVQRLAQDSQPLVYARGQKAKDLEAAIGRGYVLLKFTQTNGGTELGVPLDVAACNWSNADFEAARGSVHLEGDLKLDYVSIRMFADVDLATLEGNGHIRVIEGSGS